MFHETRITARKGVVHQAKVIQAEKAILYWENFNVSPHYGLSP